VASVAATLLVTLAGDAIKAFTRWLFLRSIGWWPGRDELDLRGKWRSTWDVDSSQYPSQVIDNHSRISQRGKTVYGSYRVLDVYYKLEGKIEDDRYVTGIWHSSQRGQYSGAFQLVVDPSGSGRMSGMWVGFSKTGEMKSGKWEWVPVRSK